MSKRARSLAVVLAVAVLPALASAAPNLIPGKTFIVKPGKLAKFIAKPTGPDFPLTVDPTMGGMTLRIYDTVIFPGPGAGDHTFNLAASGWTALGNPPGSKGYKYKGLSAVPTDVVCKIVLIKPSVIKAVC